MADIKQKPFKEAIAINTAVQLKRAEQLDNYALNLSDQNMIDYYRKIAIPEIKFELEAHQASAHICGLTTNDKDRIYDAVEALGQKLFDIGKYVFDEQKKEREDRKNYYSYDYDKKSAEYKEIKFEFLKTFNRIDQLIELANLIGDKTTRSHFVDIAIPYLRNKFENITDTTISTMQQLMMKYDLVQKNISKFIEQRDEKNI